MTCTASMYLGVLPHRCERVEDHGGRHEARGEDGWLCWAGIGHPVSLRPYTGFQQSPERVIGRASATRPSKHALSERRRRAAGRSS